LIRTFEAKIIEKITIQPGRKKGVLIKKKVYVNIERKVVCAGRVISENNIC